MADPKLLKKITMNAVLGITRATPKNEAIATKAKIAKESPDCIAVVGDMTGFGMKTTQFGESYFLTGDFYATNRVTGEVFAGSTIYLPSDLSEASVNAFKGRKAESDKITVQATISLIPDDAAATGYVFVSQAIKTPETVNRSSELLNLLASAPRVKSLAAPAAKKAG